MKKNYRTRFLKKLLRKLPLLVILISLHGYSQTITYAFANAQNTNDGTDDFYEADIVITTDTDFKLGAGQFYLDYNTAAFGTSIDGSALTFNHPAGSATSYVLDERIFGGATNGYAIVNANSTTSKLSISWSTVLAGQVSTNVTATGSPNLICHIKIKYADTNELPNITFDTTTSPDFVTSFGLTFTDGGTQITSDSYDSSGAVVPNTWSGGSTGDWHTGGNWSMGVPTTTSNITIPSGSVVNASSVVDVNTLSIPNNAALNASANINNQGAITIQSTGTNSGVLIAPSLNTNTVTYERGGFLGRDPMNMDNDKNLRWSIVAAPVAGQKIKDFVENISNGIAQNVAGTIWAVGYYDDSLPSSKWVYYTVADLTMGGTHENTTFEIGRSYAIARTSAGSVSFTGTLQVSDLNKTVTASEWNAIGNPYTAFIPSNKNSGTNFINDNLSSFNDLNVGVYVWDNSQTRYVARSLADATQTSLAPGQGFFVRTKAGVNSIIFNQSRRSTQPSIGNTIFGKNETIPSIQLKATLNDTTIDTHINYFNHTTLGLDPGYDLQDFATENFDLYTKLLQDYEGINFTVQSLPNKGYSSMLIPVGLKAVSGSRILLSAKVSNLPDDVHVYLEDKVTNTFTLFKSEKDNYQVTVSEDLDGVGRFYLHTIAAILNTDKLIDAESIKIFKPTKDKLRVIGLNSQKVTITIYTILGTKVFNKSFKGKGSNDIALPEMEKGFYLVRLQTEKGDFNKKIFID
jgi:hypothetical protein